MYGTRYLTLKFVLLTRLIRDGKWIQEVKHFCPTQPILLVGCKIDLRNDPKALENASRWGQHIVTQQEVCHRAPCLAFVLSKHTYTSRSTLVLTLFCLQGEETRQLIGALAYLECSARTKEGLDGVFEQATRAALVFANKKDEKAGCCVIL